MTPITECRLVGIAAYDASMRPRGLPADDGPAGSFQNLRSRLGASMRPRGLPADDSRRWPPLNVTDPPVGFNEAAGTTRG